MTVSLSIEVVSSSETNSHEVLLLGDGRDLVRSIASGMMGLDPDDILVEPTLLHVDAKPRRATIGRCDCGEVGCGSVEVEVSRQGETVVWSTQPRGQTFSFDAQQYEAEVVRAVADTTWETTDRTAARLIRTGVDHDALARSGLQFSWASGRLRDGKMTAALNLAEGPYQVLVHCPWRGDDPDSVSAMLVKLLRATPSTWPEVEYYPQAQDLDAPSCAGRGWRKATS